MKFLSIKFIGDVFCGGKLLRQAGEKDLGAYDIEIKSHLDGVPCPNLEFRMKDTAYVAHVPMTAVSSMLRLSGDVPNVEPAGPAPTPGVRQKKRRSK